MSVQVETYREALQRAIGDPSAKNLDAMIAAEARQWALEQVARERTRIDLVAIREVKAAELTDAQDLLAQAQRIAQAAGGRLHDAQDEVRINHNNHMSPAVKAYGESQMALAKGEALEALQELAKHQRLVEWSTARHREACEAVAALEEA